MFTELRILVVVVVWYHSILLGLVLIECPVGTVFVWFVGKFGELIIRLSLLFVYSDSFLGKFLCCFC